MKKTISMFIVAILLAVGIAPAYAVNTADQATVKTATIVSPQFIGITSISACLTIDSGGRSVSTGSVIPSDDSFTSYLTVSLQKYTSSGWTTIKSWSGSKTGSVLVVEGVYYVGRGSYRECSTATIYNAYDYLIDSATAYSSVKTY